MIIAIINLLRYPMFNKKNLLIINYAGDYKNVFLTLKNGGGETYHAQRYSVNFLGELVKLNIFVTTIVCITETYYDECLDNGVRAIGLGAKIVDENVIWQKINEIKPTHLLFTTPLKKTIFKSLLAGFNISLALADSFKQDTFKQKLTAFLLRKCFNHKNIQWIGNHNINSCLSLKKIGVNPEKIIPWDWPHYSSPNDFPPKKHLVKNNWNLIFVGTVTKTKGVGDIIQATANLIKQGFDVSLKIVGKGDLILFEKLVQRLNVCEKITFTGLLDHKAILGLMRESDLVIIPSHHEYPEGLPLTIYEALTSRTPIVASDHPMFAGRLVNNVSASIFPAKNIDLLAHAIKALIVNASAYEQLSIASENAWRKLQIPVKYGQFVSAWLEDTKESREFLMSNSLANGNYIE